jgi:hypothetical protein
MFNSLTIDVKTEKNWLVTRQHWCHLTGLDLFLFQKTTIITTQKGTVRPGDAFEDNAVKPGFENVKF